MPAFRGGGGGAGPRLGGGAGGAEPLEGNMGAGFWGATFLIGRNGALGLDC